jgi:hypothetical protein
MSSGPSRQHSPDESRSRLGSRPRSRARHRAVRRTSPGRFEHLPSRSRIERVAEALRRNGFDVSVVPDGSSAREEVLAHLSPTDEVLEAHSQTLQEVGLVGPAAPPGRFRRLRPTLDELGRQGRQSEKRRAGAAPEVVIGSVHAITESGEMVVASGSGSQLGPYSYGAGRVIWVVGAQKVVRNLSEAIRRVEEYALPREDARIRKLGGSGSSISKMLVIRREHLPHRALVVLVASPVGV